MTLLIILCITFVVTVAITGTLSTVEKCSYYKWRATNPEAFELEDKEEN